MHRYYADAMLNGLGFDRHAEELAVATFAKSLGKPPRSFSKTHSVCRCSRTGIGCSPRFRTASIG